MKNKQLFQRTKENQAKLDHLNRIQNILNCKRYRLKISKKDNMEEYEHNKMLFNVLRKQKKALFLSEKAKHI